MERRSASTGRRGRGGRKSKRLSSTLFPYTAALPIYLPAGVVEDVLAEAVAVAAPAGEHGEEERLHRAEGEEGARVVLRVSGGHGVPAPEKVYRRNAYSPWTQAAAGGLQGRLGRRGAPDALLRRSRSTPCRGGKRPEAEPAV